MLGLQKRVSHGLVKWLQVASTFLVVNFAWIFFRMPSLSDAVQFCRKVFLEPSLGLSPIATYMLAMMLMSLSIVIIKDLMEEYLPAERQFLTHRNKYVRWFTYVVLMVLILACGVFDTSQFIYVMF